MNYVDDYEDFNNRAAELLEEQSPYKGPYKPMIISYSELFKFQTCERQYYYNFDQKLRPVKINDPMDTGIKGHKLLEYFYKLLQEGKTPEEACTVVLAMANKLITSENGVDYNLLKAWTLVDNYIRATDFVANAVMVEQRFLVPASEFSSDPIFNDVQIGFTPDLVLERTGKMLDVEDYKFVGRRWSNAKIDRYQQSKLYQIFLKRMGYNVTRTTLRFFNVTTAEMTKKDYVLGPAEEATIIHDFMEGARRVVEYRNSSAFIRGMAPRTMNYTACDFCPFVFPCGLQAQGKDATQTLKTQYQKSDYDYSK